MGTHVIDARAEARAGTDAVWALLADARGWPRWSAFDGAELEREGDPPPDGVGAIRVLHRGRYTNRELVTVFEPGRRLVYELLSGLPIRDYRSEVTLDARDGTTAIRWHSEFRSKIPGTGGLVRRGLQKFIEELVVQLARAAEQGG